MCVQKDGLAFHVWQELCSESNGRQRHCQLPVDGDRGPLCAPAAPPARALIAAIYPACAARRPVRAGRRGRGVADRRDPGCAAGRARRQGAQRRRAAAPACCPRRPLTRPPRPCTRLARPCLAREWEGRNSTPKTCARARAARPTRARALERDEGDGSVGQPLPAKSRPAVVRGDGRARARERGRRRPPASASASTLPPADGSPARPVARRCRRTHGRRPREGALWRARGSRVRLRVRPGAAPTTPAQTRRTRSGRSASRNAPVAAASTRAPCTRGDARARPGRCGWARRGRRLPRPPDAQPRGGSARAKRRATTPAARAQRLADVVASRGARARVAGRRFRRGRTRRS